MGFLRLFVSDRIADNSAAQQAGCVAHLPLFHD